MDQKMRITLLGTGTPTLDQNRKGSSLLIEVGNGKLLFDAGRCVTTQLLKAGFEPYNVNPIFITHHHFDHIGNLGELLLTMWHNERTSQIDIFGPHGTSEIVDALLGKVFKRDIAFALFNKYYEKDIRDIVNVTDINSGMVLNKNEWKICAEYVNHGNSLGLSEKDWPCFGYRLEAEGKIIAISGDAVACDGLDNLAFGADVLIQCCYLAEDEINNSVLKQLAEHVIATSGQVGKIATRNNVKKLVLTHFEPKSEDMMTSLVEDIKRDYDGEICLGEDLMVIAL
jgi:ribonuclease Z